MTKAININQKQKIEDALHLLDEAALETREDIAALVSEKYKNLEKSVASIEPMIRKRMHDFSEQAEDAYHKSKEVVTKSAKEIDRSAHQNPWAFIGGSAAAGVIIGYLLARPRK